METEEKRIEIRNQKNREKGTETRERMQRRGTINDDENGAL